MFFIYRFMNLTEIETSHESDTLLMAPLNHIASKVSVSKERTTIMEGKIRWIKSNKTSSIEQ